MTIAEQERERTEFEAWWRDWALHNGVSPTGEIRLPAARAVWDAQQERIDALTRDLALAREALASIQTLAAKIAGPDSTPESTERCALAIISATARALAHKAEP